MIQIVKLSRWAVVFLLISGCSSRPAPPAAAPKVAPHIAVVANPSASPTAAPLAPAAPAPPAPVLGLAQSNLVWETESRRQQLLDGVLRLSPAWFRDGMRGAALAPVFANVVARANASGAHVLVTILQDLEDYADPSTALGQGGDGFKSLCGWDSGALKLSTLDTGRLQTRIRAYLDAMKSVGAVPSAFELGNEFDWMCFNGDLTPNQIVTEQQIQLTVTHYARFVRAAVDVIHQPQYFPDAKIVSFGIANAEAYYGNSGIPDPTQIFVRLAAQEGDSFLSHFDAYGEHLYPPSLADIAWARRMLTHAADVLGTAKPIWVTEWDVPRSPSAADPAAQRKADFGRFMSEIGSAVASNGQPVSVPLAVLYAYYSSDGHSLIDDNGNVLPEAGFLFDYCAAPGACPHLASWQNIDPDMLWKLSYQIGFGRLPYDGEMYWRDELAAGHARFADVVQSLRSWLQTHPADQVSTITRAYQIGAGFSPGPSELQYWQGQIAQSGQIGFHELMVANDQWFRDHADNRTALIGGGYRAIRGESAPAAFVAQWPNAAAPFALLDVLKSALAGTATSVHGSSSMDADTASRLAYLSVFGRLPYDSETYWRDRLADSSSDFSSVVAALRGWLSTHTDAQDFTIAEGYRREFALGVDPGSHDYWSAQLAQGASFADLEVAAHGWLATHPPDRVSAIQRAFLAGRGSSANSAEVAYWEDLMIAGRASFFDVLAGVVRTR